MSVQVSYDRGQYKRINEGLETGNRSTLGDKGFSAAYRRLSRQAQQAMEGQTPEQQARFRMRLMRRQS
jgi:hypothetical protein